MEREYEYLKMKGKTSKHMVVVEEKCEEDDNKEEEEEEEWLCKSWLVGWCFMGCQPLWVIWYQIL